jgi:hypothetical protein
MKILFRIISTIVIFVCIFVLPWWLSLTLISLAIFAFRNFYESFVLGLFMDSFFGIAEVSFFGYNVLFTIIILGVFFASIILRGRLRFY